MQRLTKEQAIIISCYTGVAACSFGDIHEAIEKKLGHPVLTHELASPVMMQKIADAFFQDFLDICYVGE